MLQQVLLDIQMLGGCGEDDDGGHARCLDMAAPLDPPLLGMMPAAADFIAAVATSLERQQLSELPLLATLQVHAGFEVATQLPTPHGDALTCRARCMLRHTCACCDTGHGALCGGTRCPAARAGGRVARAAAAAGCSAGAAAAPPAAVAATHAAAAAAAN
jgi:hypothetical protein